MYTRDRKKAIVEKAQERLKAIKPVELTDEDIACLPILKQSLMIGVVDDMEDAEEYQYRLDPKEWEQILDKWIANLLGDRRNYGGQ
jgi:hypothetical protein